MKTVAAFLFGVLLGMAQDTPQRAAPPKSGEICLVCNNRVSGKDACYLAGGQRVSLHAADCCEGEFLRHPGKYLASIRPSGILFSVWPRSGLAAAWFWLGLYILFGLLCGGLCAHKAIATGRSPTRWFLAGLCLTVLAYAWLLAIRPRALVALPPGLKKVSPTRDPVPCPRCRAGNHPSARICSGCGSELIPIAPSEVSAALQA